MQEKLIRPSKAETERLTEIQNKQDTTRLKNLLRDYRDHIITSLSIKWNIHPAEVIELVDKAISTIKQGITGDYY